MSLLYTYHMELAIHSHTVIRVLYRVFNEIVEIPRPHGTINHAVIRVSYKVSSRYQTYPGPMEQLTIR